MALISSRSSGASAISSGRKFANGGNDSRRGLPPNGHSTGSEMSAKASPATRSAPRNSSSGLPAADKSPKPPADVLFQKYFKSVGPRTYAAQIKRAGNGNHFLVLTEGKRDESSGEVRKTRLFLFSEDFVSFFRMLHETAQFIKANPVPEEVRAKRERHWAKNREGATAANNPKGAGAQRAVGIHCRTTGKKRISLSSTEITETQFAVSASVISVRLQCPLWLFLAAEGRVASA